MEYAVSPGTPLLSTDIEENGWACGGLLSKSSTFSVLSLFELVSWTLLAEEGRWFKGDCILFKVAASKIYLVIEVLFSRSQVARVVSHTVNKVLTWPGPVKDETLMPSGGT